LPFFISAASIQRQAFDLMHHESFRELQLLIATSGTGKKTLRQIVAQAFIEPGAPLIPQQQ
jgi:hypothetical protein